MFMAADFEDSMAPTWVNGRVGVGEPARRGAGQHQHARLHQGPRACTTCGRTGAWAVAILVRPRGWQLRKPHLEVDGRPAVGALVDLGLCFFYNHAEYCMV